VFIQTAQFIVSGVRKKIALFICLFLKSVKRENFSREKKWSSKIMAFSLEKQAFHIA
jgi:hypothetical protein